MICPNCNFVETEDAGFCSKCGQKFGPDKLTIRQFIGDLIDHVFNLDTNFFFTLKRIFIPGQLTLDYFAGHRKRYFHPLRLFFFLMVIHLGVLSSLVPYESIFEEIYKRRNLIVSNHENKIKLDQLALIRKDHNSLMALDSARKWMITKDSVRESFHNKGKDSVVKSGSRKIEVSSDSIPNKQDTTAENKSAFNLLEIIGKVDEADIFLLSKDSLINKYKITRFWDKLVLDKFQTFSKDPKGMIQFMIGNLSWMMVILIPLLAVFLKLLFFRRKRYYIEHLFFLYHWHSFAFLLGTMLVLIFRDRLPNLSPLFFGFIILFGLVAWKRYYQQGWIKTMIKFSLMGLVNIFLFAIFIFITMLVSAGFY